MISLAGLMNNLSNFLDTLQLDSLPTNGHSYRLYKDLDKWNGWVNRWLMLFNPLKCERICQNAE